MMNQGGGAGVLMPQQQLGVKKTPELLPDCHPLPIEFAGFEFEIKGLEIKTVSFSAQALLLKWKIKYDIRYLFLIKNDKTRENL